MKRLFTILALILALCIIPVCVSAEETAEDAALHEQLLQAMDADSAELESDDSTSLPQGLLDVLPDPEAGSTTMDVGDHTYRENEPNYKTSNANIVKNDYTVAGSLSGIDVDCFKFTLSKSSYVRFTAVADRSSYTVLIQNSAGKTVGVDSTGTYSGGYYVYGLAGQLSKGTYYISMLDMKEASSNTYLFYIDWAGTPTAKAANANNGKPKITWTAAEGAEQYIVYRSTSKSGTYSKIGTTSSRSYTDKSAKVGTTYYYRIKAVTDSGTTSAASTAVSRICKLAKPDVDIKLNKKKPQLSWDKVSGATGYQIYRATSKSGDYSRIKTTTAASFRDTTAKAGKTYYYKVRAITKNSNAYSPFSAVTSIKAK